MYKSELHYQVDCFQWFHNDPYYAIYRRLLFRIKNELDNHPYKNHKDRMVQISENQASGVISGPSDFVFAAVNPIVFIELKLTPNVQSKEQKDFMNKVRAAGHRYELCYDTLENFQNLIRFLLNGISKK